MDIGMLFLYFTVFGLHNHNMNKQEMGKHQRETRPATKTIETYQMKSVTLVYTPYQLGFQSLSIYIKLWIHLHVSLVVCEIKFRCSAV